MRFSRDSNDSLYVQWEQAFGHHKRAWIQRKSDPETDWARTGRYLNVVRVDIETGNPGGIPADFPIFCTLPDRQILEAFVVLVCAITGLDPGPVQSDGEP
jgi:hypothetical protein